MKNLFFITAIILSIVGCNQKEQPSIGHYRIDRPDTSDVVCYYYWELGSPIGNSSCVDTTTLPVDSCCPNEFHVPGVIDLDMSPAPYGTYKRLTIQPERPLIISEQRHDTLEILDTSIHYIKIGKEVFEIHRNVELKTFPPPDWWAKRQQDKQTGW